MPLEMSTIASFHIMGFFARSTTLSLIAPVSGRAKTSDELYKDITTIVTIIRILIMI